VFAAHGVERVDGRHNVVAIADDADVLPEAGDLARLGKELALNLEGG